jgi:hypothetical protein
MDSSAEVCEGFSATGTPPAFSASASGTASFASQSD